MWKREKCHLSHRSGVASDSKKIISFKQAQGYA